MDRIHGHEGKMQSIRPDDEGETKIHDIPKEVLLHIFSFLSKEDFSNVLQTNKLWNTKIIDQIKNNEIAVVNDFLNFIEQNIEDKEKAGSLFEFKKFSMLLKAKSLPSIVKASAIIRRKIVGYLKEIKTEDFIKLKEDYLAKIEKESSDNATLKRDYFEKIFSEVTGEKTRYDDAMKLLESLDLEHTEISTPDQINKITDLLKGKIKNKQLKDCEMLISILPDFVSKSIMKYKLMTAFIQEGDLNSARNLIPDPEEDLYEALLAKYSFALLLRGDVKDAFQELEDLSGKETKKMIKKGLQALGRDDFTDDVSLESMFLESLHKYNQDEDLKIFNEDLLNKIERHMKEKGKTHPEKIPINDYVFDDYLDKE